MTWNPSARDLLLSIALSDHMGDVNDCIPALARLLSESEPEWSDEWNRYVFSWEDLDDLDGDDE